MNTETKEDREHKEFMEQLMDFNYVAKFATEVTRVKETNEEQKKLIKELQDKLKASEEQNKTIKELQDKLKLVETQVKSKTQVESETQVKSETQDWRTCQYYFDVLHKQKMTHEEFKLVIKGLKDGKRVGLDKAIVDCLMRYHVYFTEDLVRRMCTCYVTAQNNVYACGDKQYHEDLIQYLNYFVEEYKLTVEQRNNILFAWLYTMYCGYMGISYNTGCPTSAQQIMWMAKEHYWIKTFFPNKSGIEKAVTLKRMIRQGPNIVFNDPWTTGTKTVGMPCFDKVIFENQKIDKESFLVLENQLSTNGL